MSDAEKLERAIYAAVDELNGQLPKGVHVEKTLDAPLYGKGGKLESIDVVGLIIEVEEKIKEEFGIAITIADERAVSEQNSPFLISDDVCQRRDRPPGLRQASARALSALLRGEGMAQLPGRPREKRRTCRTAPQCAATIRDRPLQRPAFRAR